MWPFKKKSPSTLKMPYEAGRVVWIDVYYRQHMKNFIEISERVNKMVPREKYKTVTVKEYYRVYTSKVKKIDIEPFAKLCYLLALRKFRKDFSDV